MKSDCVCVCGRTNKHWWCRWRSYSDGQLEIPCGDQIGLDGECDVSRIWGRFGPYVHVECVDGVPSFGYSCNMRPDNKLSGVKHLVDSRLSLVGSRCYPIPILKFVASQSEFSNRRDVQMH